MKTILIQAVRVAPKIISVVFLCGAMVPASWAAGNAASGRLDTTFGNGGLVSTTISAGGFGGTLAAFLSLKIQADGKLVGVGGQSGGEALITRFLVDGSLDPSFGIGGIVHINIPGRSLALQADGKIVVGGTVDVQPQPGSRDFVVARYNSDGSPDTSFGTAGKVVTDFNASWDNLVDIAIKNDGKILALGSTGDVQANRSEIALVSYNPDGSLDASFGNNGKAVSNFLLSNGPAALALQADGKIVVAGTSYFANATSGHDFLVARFNANGSVDTSFGGTGYVLTDFAAYEQLHAVALQSDGKIVAAGTDAPYSAAAYSSPSGKAALARYNTDGSLDVSFGSAGKVTTAFGDYGGQIRSVAIQTDGKIVAGGVATSVQVVNRLKESFNGKLNHAHYDFAVMRYNSNGSLDQTFGGDGQTPNGITITDFGNGSHEFNYVSEDSSEAMVIQADGKIVLAGSTNYAWGLARYNP